MGTVFLKRAGKTPETEAAAAQKVAADMLADIVILSTDIFRGVPQLNDAEVVMTIFDGKVVYRRPS